MSLALATDEATHGDMCPCRTRTPQGKPGWGGVRSPMNKVLMLMPLISRSQATWADHRYTTERDGITRYVCEPYWLTDVAVEMINVLKAMDWTVTVCSVWARHNPGQTLYVEFTPPAGVL